MKVFVINGSPKGNQSNTMTLTRAFICGMSRALAEVRKEELETEIFNISEKDIYPCRGCFSCWSSPEGNCIIKDDFSEYKSKFLEADFVIGSFPLYFFGMPSRMKTVLDRMISLMEPYDGNAPTSQEGKPYHRFRYDLSDKRFAVISTCGYSDTSNIYESLQTELDLIFGCGNYSSVLCPQGELFRFEQLKTHTDRYLAKVETAGYEFAIYGSISAETNSKIGKPILSRRTFEAVCNTRWSSSK